MLYFLLFLAICCSTLILFVFFGSILAKAFIFSYSVLLCTDCQPFSVIFFFPFADLMILSIPLAVSSIRYALISSSKTYRRAENTKIQPCAEYHKIFVSFLLLFHLVVSLRFKFHHVLSSTLPSNVIFASNKKVHSRFENGFFYAFHTAHSAQHMYESYDTNNCMRTNRPFSILYFIFDDEQENYTTHINWK